MPRNIVGFMNRFTDAKATVRELAAAGFARDQLELVAHGKSPTVVIAVTDNDAMAERAAEIMRRHGAVERKATAADLAAFNERLSDDD